MEITPEIRNMLNETRESLNGYSRRHFMAQVVFEKSCLVNGFGLHLHFTKQDFSNTLSGVPRWESRRL